MVEFLHYIKLYEAITLFSGLYHVFTIAQSPRFSLQCDFKNATIGNLIKIIKMENLNFIVPFLLIN
jgi:hypothetical protein